MPLVQYSRHMHAVYSSYWCLVYNANIHTGTVVDPPEVYETVLNCQQSCQYQSDKRGHIHIAVGTVSWSILTFLIQTPLGPSFSAQIIEVTSF